MIIGRKSEIEILKTAYNSGRPEFVAVYGRRRIGKTFLVNQTLGSDLSFKYTGIYGVSNKVQLAEFYKALKEYDLQGDDEGAPHNWFDAFRLLRQLLQRSSKRRKIIFIDELPWMDASNSKFIPALEYFWNGWASGDNSIMLIICGSASSWIINKILRNRGGLYNRVTRQLKLGQFSLGECRQLAGRLNLNFTNDMILKGYMVMGGVPYYWVNMSPTKSIDQNINDMFLKEDGQMRYEFNYIYTSMFKHPEKYIKVVQALSGKKSGLTRDEILFHSGLDSNGKISQVIEDLIECGFIRKYCHTDKKIKDAIYQLIDCYTLFYYQFVSKAVGTDEQYWLKLISTPTYNTWCGLAFERVCLLHTRQLKIALGISGIMANIFSWHVKANDEHPGAQIDLLIDRADNVVNICEMKYSAHPYTITAGMMENLKTKISTFLLCSKTRKAVWPVLITSNGVVNNKYSHEFPLKIEVENLFKD